MRDVGCGSLAYNPWTQRFRLNRFLGVGYLLAMRKAISAPGSAKV